MIRLFVALKIPEDIIEKVLTECYAATENPLRYKWETTNKIHLTLKFIGDVEEKFLDPIVSELDFVKNYGSFDCSITRFGFFFRNNLPKILWADLNTEQSFIPIVEKLSERLHKFGIEKEKRKFKSHLTLLRIKKDVSEKFIQRVKSYRFQKMNFTANKISLVQSRLSKDGASYTDLKIYELK